MSDGRVSFASTSVIVNFGQTPAFNQKNSTKISIVESSDESNIFTAPLNSKGMTLFPNTEPKLSVGLIISAPDAIAIRNQTKTLFVMVHITYEDIFGFTHWSKTQYILRVSGAGTQFNAEHGGTLTYYSEENSQIM